MPTLLCALSDLPPGSARGFGAVFAVHTAAGVKVWRDRCPHEGLPLPWRRDAYLSSDGGAIVCHAHGARFEPATGRCVMGPCLGESLTPVAAWLDARGNLVAEDLPDG
jgi:nitrite reductase/ring-hydroxylating ferredoxin subunit